MGTFNLDLSQTQVANYINFDLTWLAQKRLDSWELNYIDFTIMQLQKQVFFSDAAANDPNVFVWFCQRDRWLHNSWIELSILLKGFWMLLSLSQHHGSGLVFGHYVTWLDLTCNNLTCDFTWLLLIIWYGIKYVC